jgi:MoaA/NifB/PqqE/SkfB family radical SAM enzyme
MSRFKSRLRRALSISAILTKNPFVKPLEIAIDVSNYCRNDCLACWNYSPLRKSKPDKTWKNTFLPFSLYTDLIRQFTRYSIHPELIVLGGNGEPLYHKQLIDMIALNTHHKIRTNLTTNAIILNKNMCRKLINSKLTELNVSLHAVLPESFKTMYPNSNPINIKRISDSIRGMQRLKNQMGQAIPILTYTVVICNENIRDISAIAQFAAETGVDRINYKRFHPIPETEHLIISEQRKDELFDECNNAIEICKKHSIANNIHSFQIMHNTAEGSQLRELTGSQYKKIPCYVGYTYTRIRVDGQVNPCCGCGDSLGNVSNTPFSSIWNSEKYNAFRQRSINIPKQGTIPGCGCRSCVHLSGNWGIYRKIHPIKAMKDNP